MVVLIGFVGTWGLMLRSFWWSDLIGINTSVVRSPPATVASVFIVGTPSGPFYGVNSYRGSIYLVRDITWDKDNPPTGWCSGRIESLDDFAYSLAPGIAGFAWHWDRDYTMSFIGVPLWLVFAVPVVVVWRRRAASRRSAGGSG